MSSATGPAPGLPVRMPRPRQPGRHRRPEPLAAPEGAPALILAIPGIPTAEVRSLVDEVVSIARSELPGLNIKTGYLESPEPAVPVEDDRPEAADETPGDDRDTEESHDADSPAAEGNTDELGDVESFDAFGNDQGIGSARDTRHAEDTESPESPEYGGFFGYPRFGTHDEQEFPALADVLAQTAQAGAEERAREALDAVVVPLLAGPEQGTFDRIREAIATAGVRAELTDALGPHPLLAEALHVRLSEVGLARADRARLFTVATAADGIILATIGGEEAVRAAGVTGLLLAARLAIPVLAAGLDMDGAIAGIAEQLRSSGSGRLAVAPCVIGPELPEGLLASAGEAAGCAVAEPLGAYPAVGRLVLSKYLTLLGIAPQQPQNAPAH